MTEKELESTCSTVGYQVGSPVNNLHNASKIYGTVELIFIAEESSDKDIG